MAGLDFWQRSHESIIACWKQKPIFNTDLIREPYTDTFLKNCAGCSKVFESGTDDTLLASRNYIILSKSLNQKMKN